MSQIQEIIKAVINGELEIEVILAVIIVAVVIPIFKKLLNVDFTQFTQLSKFKKIQLHEYKDKLLSDFIDEKLENLLFYKATKINTNEKRRKIILRQYNEMNKEISMRHFKNAYFYMQFDNDYLQIEIGLFSKLFAYMMLFFSFLLVALAVLILVVMLFSDKSSQIQMIASVIMLLIYGITCLSMFRPFHSATLIKKNIKSN